MNQVTDVVVLVLPLAALIAYRYVPLRRPWIIVGAVSAAVSALFAVPMAVSDHDWHGISLAVFLVTWPLLMIPTLVGEVRFINWLVKRTAGDSPKPDLARLINLADELDRRLFRP